MNNNCNCHSNQCIKCTVSNCENHNPSENYCTLNCVTIGTHEANPTQCQCVDCQSFVMKKQK
ncbi:MAG TPA: DUF1540 domain-containing protein [Candidatus Limousia pullorum]|uniref:DUF1540 domain-containing protein n=1 Tax=Candidatus Limousia pullorum TaxID=2840860 RepID=A0A9D1LXD9_9FIRM|nr:DUF1540 domain-containing protein [Anaeromassilibacillus sp. An172]MEE0761944.1 DUF1540 domain-containing protein [Acutalibacteraceae bacterium]OUP79981.1 DUF1540 domain-containing protein [Anaeromassilibacillus sp. An172]HIU49712.1 DUF1540 domain-containing protein [Candidatus Limousia pullorum]